MLYHKPVFQAQPVGGKPGARTSMSGEPSMHQHVVSVCQDQVIFIMQRRWRGANQAEQALPPGRDVRAVLDIIWRPELCRLCEIALVEKRIERLPGRDNFKSKGNNLVD